jgi:hypothetical protein
MIKPAVRGRKSMSSKSEKRPTFIEFYLKGTVSAEDIDDYVDSWHATAEAGEIYEFLGLSEEEYALWLRDPDVLPHIARARVEGKPLVAVIHSALQEMAVASRSSNGMKIERLKRWLEQQEKNV